MSRKLNRWAALVQIGLTVLAGCHPTQPFFIAKDDHLAHYLDQAMHIDYANVDVESLPEATQARLPLGPSNPEQEYVDLTLEDCISMALNNAKILPVAGGSNLLSGSVSAQFLSAAPGQLPSVFDPAIAAATASTQPLQVDQNGNRVSQRGAVRANQVGGVEDALAEFDAQASSFLGYNTTDRPRNVGPGNVFNPQFFQAVDGNFQSALSKKTATGGVATLRSTTGYSQNNIQAPGLGRSVASDWTTALEMQITHPLMKGRGTLINRIPVVLARINEDIQTHDFAANTRNLVKAVEDAYWDLYCGYRDVEATQESLKTATELWRVASAREGVGDTSPEAKFQAQGRFYQFKIAVNAAIDGSAVPGNDPRGLRGREQILREKIGWSPTDGRMIRPIDEPTYARVEFDWYEILSEALNRNVELQRQKWAIKQRELELISAKNQLLPQLDISSTYRWVGVGDQLARADRTGVRFPDVGSNAFQELTSGDYQEVGARLEFTPNSFGARRQLALIQGSQWQLAKFHEELRVKETHLVDNLTTAYRSAEAMHDAIRLHFDEMSAHHSEIDVYLNRIQRGAVDQLSITLDQLLRAEEQRARSQQGYHRAVCEYNKALVNIHYLKGSLLDLNNISLGEGPWPSKAYWDAEELAKQRAAGHYVDYGYTRPSVVSRGRVEAGYLTEGNISSGPKQPVAEDPAMEEDSRENDKELPDIDSEPKDAPETIPTPKANEKAPITIRGGQSGGRAEIHLSSGPGGNDASRFDWGSLDKSRDHSHVEPAVSSGSLNRQRVGESYSSSQGSSLESPQWRPARSNQ